MNPLLRILTTLAESPALDRTEGLIDVLVPFGEAIGALHIYHGDGAVIRIMADPSVPPGRIIVAESDISEPAALVQPPSQDQEESGDSHDIQLDAIVSDDGPDTFTTWSI